MEETEDDISEIGGLVLCTLVWKFASIEVIGFILIAGAIGLFAKILLTQMIDVFIEIRIRLAERKQKSKEPIKTKHQFKTKLLSLLFHPDDLEEYRDGFYELKNALKSQGHPKYKIQFLLFVHFSPLIHFVIWHKIKAIFAIRKDNNEKEITK